MNNEKNHKGKQNEHYVDSWLGCGLLCMCVDGEYNSCEGEGDGGRGRNKMALIFAYGGLDLKTSSAQRWHNWSSISPSQNATGI